MNFHNEGTVHPRQLQYLFSGILYVPQGTRHMWSGYGPINMTVTIEPPVIENLTTLTGKFGEVEDRLIFEILNSSDVWDGVAQNVKEQLDLNKRRMRSGAERRSARKSC